MNNDYSTLLPAVANLAKQAGAAILGYYDQTKMVTIQLKKDDSPVTEADMAAHRVISEGLKSLTPDIPLLSEEAADIPFSTRSQWPYYWLVDPLDGTKEFIQGFAEFTVNIALIAGNKAVLGVVYIPVLKSCYSAAAGLGAFKQQGDEPSAAIHVRKLDSNNKVAAVSRRRTSEGLQRFLDRFQPHSLIKKGSSIKSCLVAEGSADIYPSFGLTSEWDTAASQCIVEEAGGELVDLHMQPLCYNTKESLLNPYFIVIGDKNYKWNEILCE